MTAGDSHIHPHSQHRLSDQVLANTDDFLEAYPTVSANLYLLDRFVNLVDEGIDAALRIAHLPDSSMVAVRVGEVRRVITAAPSYLARHPRIDEPADLAKQQIIAMNHFGVDSWSFPPADGSTIPRTVHFTPRLVVNSVSAALASAVEGRGVTRLFSYQVAEHLRDGRLRILLRSDIAGSHRRAARPAFRSESPRLRRLRRAAVASAVRAPRRGCRSVTLTRERDAMVDHLLGEPVVNRGEEIACFGAAALVAAEPGEAYHSARFPELVFDALILEE